MSSKHIETSLLRQLRRAGLEDGERAPNADEWARFLRVVNEYYRHLDQDREVLVRSNEVASDAATRSQTELSTQRAGLREVLSTIADALGDFGRVARGEADEESLPKLSTVTDRANGRLLEVLGDRMSEDSSVELSGVRTNLVRLAEELGRLQVEMREKARLTREMEAASLAQSLLVPANDLLVTDHVEVAGACHPAGDCGGDWWQIYRLPDGSLMTLLGDVTGHGVASSVIAGVAKAASHVAVATGVTQPTEVLALMNTAIHEAARRQIMMTCVASLLDPLGKTVTIANAGHHFPYHLRGTTLRSVVLHGAPLGSSAVAECEPTSVDLAPGDVLVWYTDGLVDGENEWGEQFGEKRLRAICQRLVAEGAKAMRDGVLEALAAFRDRQPANDDTTLVVMVIK